LKLLLDTHTFFWWSIDQAKLSPKAFAAIKSRENEVHVSIASAWEMAIEVGNGKWPEAADLLDCFEAEAIATGFRILPISLAQSAKSGATSVGTS
jgi:PIN domain nuclease of toxin-antitoxin system